MGLGSVTRCSVEDDVTEGPETDPELASEIARFDALKPRLATLWNTIFPGDVDHYTSVIVPSMTLDQSELRKIAGATFYEERLLFLLIRLRNPRAHMVYVTSQPIHPLVLEYYFQSSGANFLGAVKVQDELWPDADVVTVFPDDDKKYLSTDLLRDEPIRRGYMTPEIRLLGFDALSRG